MNSKRARTVLELPPNGGLEDEDVQQAYREQAKKYHPDTSDHSNAREKFLEIKKAREVLLAANTTQTSESSSTQSKQSRTTTSSTSTSSDRTSSSSGSDTWSSSTASTNESHSDWRSETVGQSTQGGTGTDWQANTTSSETHQQKRNWTETDTGTDRQTEQSDEQDTTSSGAEGRTKAHQRAWDTFDWETNHGFSASGYLGVDEFPERPPSRSRIGHFVAVLLGCIATALFSRGQYQKAKSETASSRVIEPEMAVRASFGMPVLLAAGAAFRKAKLLWRFFLLPRVFLSITGGAVAPVVIHSVVTPLSVFTASGVAIGGAGTMMGLLALWRHDTADNEIPTVDKWLDAPPVMSWLPGGALVLVGIHTPFYLASRSFPRVYYESFQFYLVLLGAGIVVAFLLSQTSVISETKVTPGVTVLSMIGIGVLIHLPWFEPMMPGYVLFGPDYYSASSGYRFDGILMTIWAMSWVPLTVAVMEVLTLGWDVGWHKLPSEQSVPYTVWNALVGGGIGVVIWAVWPAYPAPVDYHIAHQYLVAGTALFVYVYGIVTDPITG